MSYTGGHFTHDVFVTYSQGDVTGNGDSSLKQWSRAFARELEFELRAYPSLGGKVSVFFDEQRRPGDGVDPLVGLTEQLQKEVAGSAMLTVLMSPHYLGSSWCRNERDWWRDAQKEISHDGRIAIARIWPVAKEAEWPPLFIDSRGEPLLGFLFYDRARAESRPQPFEWPLPTRESKGPFRDALLDLAGAISLKLQDLRKAIEVRRREGEEAAKLAGTGQVVYLHGRQAYAKAWEEAYERLAQYGLQVLPGDPDPVEQDPVKAQELRKNRIDTLTGCDALLLLGSPDGRAVDADLAVVGRHDRHSAKAVSNRLLPCALLDTVGAPIATSQRQRAARALQVDWIDGTADPWVPAVQKWLVEKSAALRGGGP